MAYSDNHVTQVHLHDLRPGMRLTPLQSRPSTVTEAEIDDVIATTLAENRQIAARAALPVIAHQDELTGTAGRNSRAAAAQDGAAAAWLGEVASRHGPERVRPGAVEDLTGAAPSALRRMGSWRLLGRWPLRAAALLAVLAVFVLAPWAIPLAIGALGLAVVALGLAMGTDRVSGALTRVFHWRNARNPGRAERYRARVDRLAAGMDALLDRLPERWTAGLYMPDFSREALLQDSYGDRPDPFDRIAAEGRRV